MDEYRQTDIETDSRNDFIVDVSTFQCFSESTTYVELQDRTILKHLVHTHTHFVEESGFGGTTILQMCPLMCLDQPWLCVYVYNVTIACRLQIAHVE